jgi:hypothetical protein
MAEVLSMRRRLSAWCLLGGKGVLVAAASIMASAIVVSIAGAKSSDVVSQSVPAVADTYLRSGASNTNEGGSSFVRVRASGDNRALVRFDQSALEAAAANGTVVSAELELTISGNGNNWGTTGRTISLYRLTRAWVEGNGFVDQGSPPNRGIGAGATWQCASDSNIASETRDCSGATQWEMAKPNEPSSHPWIEPATSSTLITNGLTGTVGFDVTQDVQLFLSGSAQNFGWIVKKDVEGAAGEVQFASREFGSSEPRLVLQVETLAPDDQYGPEEPPNDPTGPFSDEAPSGGADNYDPDLDTDNACDAYVDFGIENWCQDPGGLQSLRLRRTSLTSAALTSISATAPDYSSCRLEAVFWSIGPPASAVG